MSVDRLLLALGLPETAQVDRRVPKKVFLDQGGFGATDRRQIQEGLEELYWVAALKPNTVGIPVFRDEIREYLEITVVKVTVREGAKEGRLLELLHRSIPYPLVIVLESRSGVVLSLAHKRISQSEKSAVVVEREFSATVRSFDPSDVLEKSFLDALNLSALSPVGDLFDLYKKWIDRVVARNVSLITGYYRIPESASGSESLMKEMDSFSHLEKTLGFLRLKATKEKQMARRVELNLEIKRKEQQRERIKVALLGDSGLGTMDLDEEVR